MMDDLLRVVFCREFHPADEVVPFLRVDKKRSVSNFVTFFSIVRCVVYFRGTELTDDIHWKRWDISTRDLIECVR